MSPNFVKPDMPELPPRFPHGSVASMVQPAGSLSAFFQTLTRILADFPLAGAGSTRTFIVYQTFGSQSNGFSTFQRGGAEPGQVRISMSW